MTGQKLSTISMVRVVMPLTAIIHNLLLVPHAHNYQPFFSLRSTDIIVISGVHCRRVNRHAKGYIHLKFLTVLFIPYSLS